MTSLLSTTMTIKVESSFDSEYSSTNNKKDLLLDMPILGEEGGDDAAAPTGSCDLMRHTAAPAPLVTPEKETTIATHTLEQAQDDARQSARALEDLLQGMRAIKRLLDRPEEKDETMESLPTTDLQRVAQCADRLPGRLGSELLGLLNSADRLRQTSQLTVEESSTLVQDLAEVQTQNEAAQQRAQQAERDSRKLLKQTQQLSTQVQQLKFEKKVLVKEVKSLRSKAEETRRFDTWRLLEEHVLDSVALHELVLKTPSPKHSMQDTQGRSCSFDSNDVERSAKDEEDWEQTPAPTSTKVATNSPIPSLDETTQGSWSEARTRTTSEASHNNGLPDNISTATKTREASPLHLSSPVTTTDEAKPLCDPRILKTLAIPSQDGMANATMDYLHFRPITTPQSSRQDEDEMGPGLYEC